MKKLSAWSLGISAIFLVVTVEAFPFVVDFKQLMLPDRSFLFVVKDLTSNRIWSHQQAGHTDCAGTYGGRLAHVDSLELFLKLQQAFASNNASVAEACAGVGRSGECWTVTALQNIGGGYRHTVTYNSATGASLASDTWANMTEYLLASTGNHGFLKPQGSTGGDGLLQISTDHTNNNYAGRAYLCEYATASEATFNASVGVVSELLSELHNGYRINPGFQYAVARLGSAAGDSEAHCLNLCLATDHCRGVEMEPAGSGFTCHFFAPGDFATVARTKVPATGWVLAGPHQNP